MCLLDTHLSMLASAGKQDTATGHTQASKRQLFTSGVAQGPYRATLLPSLY